MKNLFILASLGLFSSWSNATDISCNGTITWVMADHPSCTDDSGKKQLAYKLSTGDYWFCSGSDAASSLILSAKVTNAQMLLYINNDNGATCQIHSHYMKASYIIAK